MYFVDRFKRSWDFVACYNHGTYNITAVKRRPYSKESLCHCDSWGAGTLTHSRSRDAGRAYSGYCGRPAGFSLSCSIPCLGGWLGQRQRQCATSVSDTPFTETYPEPPRAVECRNPSKGALTLVSYTVPCSTRRRQNTRSGTNQKHIRTSHIRSSCSPRCIAAILREQGNGSRRELC